MPSNISMNKEHWSVRVCLNLLNFIVHKDDENCLKLLISFFYKKIVALLRIFASNFTSFASHSIEIKFFLIVI